MAEKRMLFGGQMVAIDDEAGRIYTASGGSPTDEPVAYNGADEDATARTGVSLLKRIANALKAVAATLVTISGKINNPAQSSDVAAVTSAVGTSNTSLAEIVLLHRLLRGKCVASSGVTLTCTANATDHTQAVTSGATYRITAGSGRILLGESDTTSAANVLMVVMPGQTVLYQAQSAALHFSTVDGAGITARLSRVDMA